MQTTKKQYTRPSKVNTKMASAAPQNLLNSSKPWPGWSILVVSDPSLSCAADTVGKDRVPEYTVRWRSTIYNRSGSVLVFVCSGCVPLHIRSGQRSFDSDASWRRSIADMVPSRAPPTQTCRWSDNIYVDDVGYWCRPVDDHYCNNWIQLNWPNNV